MTNKKRPQLCNDVILLNNRIQIKRKNSLKSNHSWTKWEIMTLYAFVLTDLTYELWPQSNVINHYYSKNRGLPLQPLGTPIFKHWKRSKIWGKGPTPPVIRLSTGLLAVASVTKCPVVYVQAVRYALPSVQSSTALRWCRRQFLTRSSEASRKLTTSPTSTWCASKRQHRAHERCVAQGDVTLFRSRQRKFLYTRVRHDSWR